MAGVYTWVLIGRIGAAGVLANQVGQPQQQADSITVAILIQGLNAPVKGTAYVITFDGKRVSLGDTMNPSPLTVRYACHQGDRVGVEYNSGVLQSVEPQPCISGPITFHPLLQPTQANVVASALLARSKEATADSVSAVIYSALNDLRTSTNIAIPQDAEAKSRAAATAALNATSDADLKTKVTAIQRTNGLPITGTIDTATLEKLAHTTVQSLLVAGRGGGR